MICRLTIIALFALAMPLTAQESELPQAAKRGKSALQNRVFNDAMWNTNAYQDAWKFWDNKPAQSPDNYLTRFMQYYGLHKSPFGERKYPMGIRVASGLFGKGLTTDCLLCHGGSIMGKSYVGLGNASLDIQALFQDMAKASGKSGRLPFTFSQVRGTSEAGAMAVFLLAHRQPNLNLRLKGMDLDLNYTMCEDPPAWWLLQKKKTMYHTGATPAKSIRSIMQFMLASTKGRAAFEKEEKTFADIQAYLHSLKPPEYPFKIDRKLAAQGRGVFKKNCATCHGTYGKDWTYPNKVVPLSVIGTDTTRFYGISAKWGDYYNKSWFAQKEITSGKAYPVTMTKGYQAPPLDGVWATAPYLHNGSVPTLYHMLQSDSRPKIYTRSFRTGEADYDKINVGWKVQVLPKAPGGEMSPYERRKIYDTTQPGRGNQGHEFGDDLSESERRAVIEYLKTL